MSQHKRIFIIGHSGSGKRVIAKAIVKKLGWKFVNTDVLGAAPNIGRTVTEIFGAEGKKGFMRCLTDILSYQMTKNNVVVTTDESIIVSEEIRELLSSEFTVYIKVSVPVQLERLSDYRPLLPVKNFSALLEKLHHERNSLYEQVASFSLSSDGGNIEEHAEKIIKAASMKN